MPFPLPTGLISAAPGRRNSGLQASAKQVEGMVRAKMEQKEYIILCLEDSNDWSNATSRRMVMQARASQTPDAPGTAGVGPRPHAHAPFHGGCCSRRHRQCGDSSGAALCGHANGTCEARRAAATELGVGAACCLPRGIQGAPAHCRARVNAGELWKVQLAQQAGAPVAPQSHLGSIA